MKKLLVMVGVLVCASVAAAQTVNPLVMLTQPITNGESYNVGGKSASVQQKVNLNLPQATGLHLTVNTLDFDISKIGNQDSSWACVYGDSKRTGNNVNGDTDVPFGDGWGQHTYKPLGTAYEEADDFGSVYVTGGPKVTSYPPISFTGDASAGNLVAGSKNHFVCYRVFRLQKFSNLGNFDLTVTRSSDPKDGTFQLYMQDDPCYIWKGTGTSGLNADTPLMEVTPGSTLHLIPVGKGAGTTGALAATNKQYCWGKDADGNYSIGKSWLDDAVVVAVKVDGDKAGMNTANLTYTLNSSATAFTGNSDSSK